MRRHLRTLFSLTVLSALLAACSLPGGASSKANSTADVYFEVEIPTDTASSGEVFLELIDLTNNMATRNAMSVKDERHFDLTLALPVGGISHYRYIRQAQPADMETDPTGAVISQRVLLVQAPMHVQDIVSSWMSAPYNGPLGTIQGLVTLADGSPATGMTVAIAGYQIQTGQSGEFELTQVRPGTHLMLIYTTDNKVTPFQQQVMVAPNMITPVTIRLSQ